MVLKRNMRDGEVVFASEKTSLQIATWSEQRDSIDFDGTSARVEIPDNAEVIELVATENCYIHFGDVSVDATAVIATDGSRLFLSGVQTVIVPLDSSGMPFTHIAALEATAATPGILQVEEVN